MLKAPVPLRRLTNGGSFSLADGDGKVEGARLAVAVEGVDGDVVDVVSAGVGRELVVGNSREREHAPPPVTAKSRRSVPTTDHSYVRPSSISGSLAEKVASVPS